MRWGDAVQAAGGGAAAAAPFFTPANPSPGIPGAVPLAKAWPDVPTCASHPGTPARAANASVFDGVGASSETGTERVRLVFESALRLQQELFMGMKLPFCNTGKLFPFPGKLLCGTAGK